MQYCPNCKVRIRGNKAHCPLCEREVVNIDVNDDVDTGGDRDAADTEMAMEDDPFVRLPSPRVSFMLMVRTVTFVCVTLEILLGAAQIISGSSGWLLAIMLFILLGWIDFQAALYYRNNLIRMLTTQAYIIMGICLLIAAYTRTGSWAVSWVVPIMFGILIIVTFGAAKLQGMELHEYILYPVFDVLMSMLQIIPVALGRNPVRAPAVLCISMMLILARSFLIFRNRA